jgi:predicted MFS family arabinose efflux permease
MGVILAALGSGGLLGHGFSVAADYVDRRLLASAGAFVVGLGLIAFALGQSFVVLVVAGLVSGAASDAFVAGCEVTLVQLYPDALAPALARVNGYGAIGDLLGPLTLTAAAALGFGWRSVFALAGGLMLLYALALVRQEFPPSRKNAGSTTPVEGIVRILRNRQIIRLAMVDGLFGLLDEPFQGFTIAYLERERGVPAAVATLVIASWVVAAIVGYFAVAGITARLAPRTILLSFGGIIAVSVASIAFGPDLTVQTAGAMAFGFAGAVFYSVLQTTYLSQQSDQAGTIHAVVSTIGLFGIAFPALVGVVVDQFGLAAGLGVYAAIPPLILVLLVGNFWHDSSPSAAASPA